MKHPIRSGNDLSLRRNIKNRIARMAVSLVMQANPIRIPIK